MSGQCTGWVLRHGPRPEHLDRHGKPYGARARGLRSVLVAVGDAANRDGHHAHPGIDNVADAALYGRRQTISLLAELVAEGWLVIEEEGGGRGLATVYRVPMPEGGKGATATPPETVQDELGKGATDPPETVQSEAERVRSGVHPNGVTTEPTNGNDQRATEASLLAAGFERFWSVYPRATAKGAARAAWPAAVKAARSIEVIVAGAGRYRDDPNREDRFTAHASTWLRGERWNDPPLPPRSGRASAQRIIEDREGPSGRIDL